MCKDWDILEISPTTDVSVIKKAYAKKLKINRPDDDPEGFQLLREAYESALQYVKNYQYYQEEDSEENSEETHGVLSDDYTLADNNEISFQNKLSRDKSDKEWEDNDDHEKENDKIFIKRTSFTEGKYEDNDCDDEYNQEYNDGYEKENINRYEEYEDEYKEEYEDDYEEEYEDDYDDEDEYEYDEYVDNYPDLNINDKQQIDNYFEKVYSLYQDFFSRIEEKNWEEILNDEILWKMDYKECINDRFLQFISENHFLPQTVWNMLNQVFHWDEQETVLEEYFPEIFKTYLFLQLSGDIVPRYCHFDKNINIDYEEYLSYREEAFISLHEADIENAEGFLSKAYDLYQKDPDLLCMKGELYLYNNDRHHAEEAFESAKKIQPDDMLIYLYQAQIWFNHRHYKYALKICNFINTYSADIPNVLILKGRCFHKMKKYHKASEIFLNNMKRNPSDMSSKRYLIIISDEMKDLLMEKDPFNIIMKKDLKEIYIVLGEREKIKELKYNIKIVVKRVLLIIIMLISFIIGILLWFSKIGIQSIGLGLIILVKLINKDCNRIKSKK